MHVSQENKRRRATHIGLVRKGKLAWDGMPRHMGRAGEANFGPFDRGPVVLVALGSRQGLGAGLAYCCGLPLGGFGPTKELELGLGLRPQQNKNKL